MKFFSLSQLFRGAPLAVALALASVVVTDAVASPSYTYRIYSPGVKAAAVAPAVPAAPVDPFGGQVSLLMHFEGLNGGTALTDELGRAVSNSGAYISTATAAPGSSSSLAVKNGDQITMSAADLAFPGDFTEEFYAYYTGGTAAYLDTYSYANVGRQFYIWANGSLEYYYQGGAAIQSSVAVTPNTWHHFAASRAGSTIYLFLDGVLVASKPNITGTLGVGTALMALNFQQAGGARFYANGYIDEVRITKGVARYTTGFVPPVAPFPGP